MAVSLLVLADLEPPLGVADDAEDEARRQYIIDTVSEYICSMAHYQFEETTDTIRYVADRTGVVDLSLLPVTEVISIQDFNGDDITCGRFDNAERIYNLPPNQVVYVNYTHGYSSIPSDIHQFAIDTCAKLLDTSSPYIKMLQVGDVVRAYRAVSNFVEREGGTVLDNYRETEYTMRLGSGGYPDYDSNQVVGL